MESKSLEDVKILIFFAVENQYRGSAVIHLPYLTASPATHILRTAHPRNLACQLHSSCTRVRCHLITFSVSDTKIASSCSKVKCVLLHRVELDPRAVQQTRNKLVSRRSCVCNTRRVVIPGEIIEMHAIRPQGRHFLCLYVQDSQSVHFVIFSIG